MVESLVLPELDAEALGVVNDLIGVARSFPVSIGDEEFTVRFTPPPELASGLAAALAVGGRRVWLAFSDWNKLGAVRELLDGEPLDRVPTAILPALLIAALERNLDQLAQLAGGPSEIATVEPLEQLPAGMTRIGIELSAAEKTVRGILFADAAALDLLRDAAKRLPPVVVHPRGDLPLSAGVEIGLTQLAFDELRSLGVGDLILLDVAAPREKPTGLLRFAPQAVWRVDLAGGKTTLREPVKLAHWGRDGATGRTAALVFEHGRVELTAAEVAALAPGAELARTDDDTVAIRRGHAVLGRGELVYLGARTGVRIEKWFIRR